MLQARRAVTAFDSDLTRRTGSELRCWCNGTVAAPDVLRDSLEGFNELDVRRGKRNDG